MANKNINEPRDDVANILQELTDKTPRGLPTTHPNEEYSFENAVTEDAGSTLSNPINAFAKVAKNYKTRMRGFKMSDPQEAAEYEDIVNLTLNGKAMIAREEWNLLDTGGLVIWLKYLVLQKQKKDGGQR